MPLERLIWCSARTRLDIRDTSILCMNASKRSAARYGEERDSPNERFGITDELHHREQKSIAIFIRRGTHCSSRSSLRNSQNASLSASVSI